MAINYTALLNLAKPDDDTQDWGSYWRGNVDKLEAAVVQGPASATDNRLAQFDGITGRKIKASTLSGLVKLTSGVPSAAVAGTDFAAPTTGTSVLKGNGAGGFAAAEDGIDLTPVGGMMLWFSKFPKAGYFFANGASLLRSSYSALFDAIVPSRGNVTISIGADAVCTLVDHGFLDFDPVILITTGVLPTGLTANTIYYVNKINDNSFYLWPSGGLWPFEPIDTTGSQSGVHTIRYCPAGIADSTHFNLPNMVHKIPYIANTTLLSDTIGAAVTDYQEGTGGNIPLVFVNMIIKY